MNHFLQTVDSIAPGLGFPYFGTLHLTWLAVFVLFTLLSSLLYRNASPAARKKLRLLFAALLLADEAFKTVCLLVGGLWLPDYLPLHLCSINIFLIALHAVRPSEAVGSFLYAVCIPAAIAALLFPTWVSLPLANFMHLHSFTVHILLAAYPIVLTAGGDIQPKLSAVPKCLMLLIGMAIPTYVINLLLGTNFMFLMYAEPGNPLYWFETTFGAHEIGFPVLIAAVIVVMHAPQILRMLKKTSA